VTLLDPFDNAAEAWRLQNNKPNHLKDYIPLAFAEPFGPMPTDNSCPRSFAFRCWTWRIQASECVLFAEQLQGPDLAKGYDIERHNLLAITYSFKGWR
jgi:hypothetical protein